MICKSGGDPTTHKLMTTLQHVRQLQAAEKAAKDAFWAAAGTAGTSITAEQRTLQAAMQAATKARQQAMADYAASIA